MSDKEAQKDPKEAQKDPKEAPVAAKKRPPVKPRKKFVAKKQAFKSDKPLEHRVRHIRLSSLEAAQLIRQTIVDFHWTYGVLELKTTIHYCLQFLRKNYSLEITSFVLEKSLSKARQQIDFHSVVEVIEPQLTYH